MKHSTFSKTFLLTTAIFLLHSATVLAQMNANVLFVGIAIDAKTKKPIEVRYEINNPSGQKFRGKSMSDGTFQQVLKPGESYTITFGGKGIFRAPEEISLRPSDKYYEEQKTFSVEKVNPGQQIAAMNLFKNGTAEIIESEQEVLKRILSGVKNEDFSSVIISIAEDTPAKNAKKVKAKKSKNAPVNTLVNTRIEAINELLKPMASYVREKVTIAPAKGKAVASVSVKAGN